MMKKTLLTLLLSLTILSPTLAKVPHRLVYGYFLTNKSTADYGLGRFYMDDPQNIEIIAPGDQIEGWFAGAVAGGIYYACPYEYSITEGPVPSSFISIDLATGERRTIGDWSEDDFNTYLKYQDMTFDYATNTMYAVGFYMGRSSLYTFDLTTGKSTKVVDLNVVMAALACTYDGQLYGYCANNATLYTIDKTTGACTPVINLGDNYLFSVANMSMDFDHTTGDLYIADRSTKLESRRDFLYLVRVSLSQDPIVVEDVAQVGDDAEMNALYIPFVLAGEDAPAAPTNVSIVPAEMGVPEVSLSWTTPLRTFGDAPLTGLELVRIKRDGEIIATLEAAGMGVEMSYTDRNVADGQHLYAICCVNSVGEGEVAQRFAYVGRDCPDEAQNIRVKVGEGCQSATIMWDEPVKGYHNGYFTTDGLTYSIKRYPDQTMLATGLTERSFTDNSLRRLGAYSYEIIAQNEFGSTGQYTPDTYVLGAPIALANGDFVEDFNDRTRFLNQWTEVDANNDYYTWVYNTDAPQYVLGGNDPGAAYFLNPGIYNLGLDADEWLISPPLRFDADKNYEVVLHVRSVIAENLAVTFGTTNEVEEQQVVRDFVIEPSAYNTNQVALYTDYEINLPRHAEETIGCVGIYLHTPFAATQNFTMLHINSITVKEGVASGISQIQNSEFRTQCYYDLQGRRLEAQPAKGLYIANGRKYIVR